MIEKESKLSKKVIDTLATKKEMKEGFDKLNKKIEGVAYGLGEQINDLKETQEVFAVKMDALIGTTEKFINRVEKEEQERKFGQKQLERRVEKLEAKV
ncbi:MAG: hypothetical protein Q7S57_03230 [bacterium]|nr:hypothetical protein [bacterium]